MAGIRGSRLPGLNRHQKSDMDIADWRPPRDACWFAARVKAVKAKYGLTMDSRERQAVEAVLARCSPAERRALAVSIGPGRPRSSRWQAGEQKAHPLTGQYGAFA